VSAICLILNSPDIEGAILQVEENRQYINLAELRVDLLKPSERTRAAELPEKVQIPLILTIRLAEDGGRWGINGESEAERINLFLALLNSAPWSFVDIEGNHPLTEVRRAAEAVGAKIIRSVHDFSDNLLSGPVPVLTDLISRLGAEGNILKIAANCADSAALLNLARAAAATKFLDKKILIAMGEYGSPSRILSQRHGSLWTYATSLREMKSQPGQLQPKTLEKLYRFRKIDKSTPLFAVVGNPIAHSKSPVIHNRWLQDLDVEGTYIPIRTDNLAGTLETCDIWDISGLSVTIPHKEVALTLADSASNLAQKTGSANTLIKTSGGWRAENTDAEGFLQSLKEGMGTSSEETLFGRKALIIGAGGAARAVAHVLCNVGMKLTILNRSIDKARTLAEECKAEWGPLDKKALPKLASGIFLAVQTTSLGMPPNERIDPIPWWNPVGCSFVYDVIYGSSETPFLRRAQVAGCQTISGLAMFKAQARLQFQLFTGIVPPSPV